MPFIKVETNKISQEQKEELIAGITKCASKAIGLPEQVFYVVVQENSDDNWGVGGKSLTQIKNNKA